MIQYQPYDATTAKYIRVQTALNLLGYLNALSWWEVPHGEKLLPKLRADVCELIHYLKSQSLSTLAEVPRETIDHAKETENA